MKVVVQHPITHHYLTPSNEWKSGVENARLFKSAADAVTYSFKNVNPPYNVVLKFEDPRYDFTVMSSEDRNPGVLFGHRPSR